MVKDGSSAREQSTRIGVPQGGSHHIVVGQFGDPKPMIMGVTSSNRKNSPRSLRKNDVKATRRQPGAQAQAGAATLPISDVMQEQAFGHSALNGESQIKNQGIDGVGLSKASNDVANGSMIHQKLHQKNQ